MKSFIYLDVLFFVNLIVNYLMLLSAGKIAGAPVRHKRLGLASCAGALYSILALVLPCPIFFSFPARILIGLMMVKLSYSETCGVQFISLAASFYGCSVLVAGTALAIDTWGKPYLTGITSDYPSARWWVLAAAVAAVTAGGFAWKALNLAVPRRLPLVNIEISLGGRSITLTGMIDTGNQLRDPISGLPVVVVDWDSLKPIMPQELTQFFLSPWDLTSTDIAGRPGMAKRLRLIPYTTVSGQRQLLLGFKPDGLYLKGKHGRTEADAVIGVAGKPLSPQGQYQALLHPELVNAQGGVLI